MASRSEALRCRQFTSSHNCSRSTCSAAKNSSSHRFVTVRTSASLNPARGGSCLASTAPSPPTPQNRRNHDREEAIASFVAKESLPTKNDVDAGEQQLHLGRRDLADAFREERFVERHNLRDIRHGVLGEAGRASTEPHVSRRVGPLEIACERYAHHRRDAASVQRVTLNDSDRPAKAWF